MKHKITKQSAENQILYLQEGREIICCRCCCSQLDSGFNHFPSHFYESVTPFLLPTQRMVGALPIFTASHTWPVILQSEEEFSVLESCKN